MGRGEMCWTCDVQAEGSFNKETLRAKSKAFTFVIKAAIVKRWNTYVREQEMVIIILSVNTRIYPNAVYPLCPLSLVPSHPNPIVH
jgi:hypothetical protein